MKKFVYFSIFVSLLGAKVLSFGVGPYQMSLFRIAMILIIVVLFVTKNRDFILWLNGNMFSTVFMAFWCLYALVSIIWSKDISAWLRNMFFLFIALIVILVFNNVFQDKEDIISAFKAFQWGIIVQSIIGWYEVFTKNYLFVEINSDFERIYIKSSLRVPIAMTDNPNNFATLMFIGVFISYICICNSVAIEKQFYKIVLVSDVLLLLFTSSRANILALALSVLFWVAHHKGKLLVLLASCVFIFLLQPEVVIERLVELDFSSSAVMNSNNIRLNLILNGFKFLIDTYGFGVGAGQIGYWISNYALFNTHGMIDMHNWWMEIMTAYGIYVFVGYLIYYLTLFKAFYTNYIQTNDVHDKKISFTLCSMMVGYIIASISSSSNISNEYIWIFWGICIVYQGVMTNSSEKIDGKETFSL